VNLKFFKKYVNTTFPITVAILLPMQLLGPIEKGMKGASLLYFSHLSGMYYSGFSKYFGFMTVEYRLYPT
jgi:hypothetical protein